MDAAHGTNARRLDDLGGLRSMTLMDDLVHCLHGLPFSARLRVSARMPEHSIGSCATPSSAIPTKPIGSARGSRRSVAGFGPARRRPCGATARRRIFGLRVPRSDLGPAPVFGNQAEAPIREPLGRRASKRRIIIAGFPRASRPAALRRDGNGQRGGYPIFTRTAPGPPGGFSADETTPNIGCENVMLRKMPRKPPASKPNSWR